MSLQKSGIVEVFEVEMKNSCHTDTCETDTKQKRRSNREFSRCRGLLSNKVQVVIVELFFLYLAYLLYVL